MSGATRERNWRQEERGARRSLAERNGEEYDDDEEEEAQQGEDSEDDEEEDDEDLEATPSSRNRQLGDEGTYDGEVRSASRNQGLAACVVVMLN